jgi:signal transduction histidine kinase
MAADGLSKPRFAGRVPEGIVALGAGLLAAQPGTQVLIYGPAVLLVPEVILGLGLTALFAVPLIYAGLWLRRSSVDPERYLRVGIWCGAIMTGFLAVNLVMMTAWPAPTLGENVGWAVISSTIGASGGTLFGTIEARAIERSREAERAALRTEQLETQRQWLEYLNSLLRHEVLNTANVVVGYAELLKENHDGDETTLEYLDRVARQSSKMTDVIQDVRLLIEATSGEADLERVDVVSVLEDEVTALSDRHDDVSVTTSWPDSAVVAADDLLARVFSNVLENAVLHNDAETPHVEVAVRTDPECVTVTIADDGPGVPDEERDSLFEQQGRGDHGLGLYLVNTLLGRYGGSIELEETGPEGSVFAIELPPASAEATVEEEQPAATPNVV